MKAPILVATDFSEASEAAVACAVVLARRLSAPIELVHVLERVPVDAVSGPEFGAFAHTLADRAAALDDAMRDALGQKLRAKAEELAATGVSVSSSVLAAARPWDGLLEVAERLKARMIVMGTHGRRGAARWLLGSVAERTVRGAPCPVLVVPAAARFGAWVDESRHLRIALALDLGEPAPVSFLRDLRGACPSDVTAIHLYWPPAEMKRRGISAPFDLEAPPEAIQASVEKELRTMIGQLPGKGTVSFFVRPEWGRLSDPLLRIASELSADLLVVGTHGRHVLDGSTASGLLKRIDLPVAFVPVPARHAPP